MIILEVMILCGGLLTSLMTGVIIDHYVMIRRQSRPK